MRRVLCTCTRIPLLDGRRRLVSNIPKQFRDLGSAAPRGKWGSIADLTADERDAVASGSWSAGCAETTFTAAGDDAVEKCSFDTQEEAEAFLQEVDEDAKREANVPVFTLAKHFYEDLAKNADEDLDAEAEALTPKDQKTDEERAEEARDVQRQFFADYYVAQGCVPHSMRDTFVSVMLSPPVSFLCPDPNFVLSRVTVRQQLERHCGNAVSNAVFRAVPWCDAVFSVGEAKVAGATRAPTAGASRHVEGQHVPCPTLPTSEADALAAMLEESTYTNSLTASETTSSVASVAASPAAPDTSLTVPTTLPAVEPTVMQLYWLQRVIRSGTVVDMDLMGLLLPLVAGVRPEDNIVVFHEAGQLTGNAALGGGYIEDVLRYMQQLASCSGGLCGAVVQVCRPLPRDAAAEQLQRSHSVSGTPKSVAPGDALLAPVDVEEDAGDCSDAALVTDPHVVRVTLSHRRQQLSDPLVYHSVLCTPRTSGDGLRPRVQMTSDEGQLQHAPLNHAMSAIAGAGSRFAKLVGSARYGLASLRPLPRTTGRRCRFVYAVNSMNPLECEAVMAAALHQANLRLPDARSRYRVVPVAEALGVTLDEGRMLFGSMVEGWGNGLVEWMSVERAPVESESSFAPLALREEIARGAWRLRPVSDNTNGGFLCAVELSSECTVASECDLQQDTSACASGPTEEGSSSHEPFEILLPTGTTSPDVSSVVLVGRHARRAYDALMSSTGTNARAMNSRVGAPLFASGTDLIDPLLSGTPAATWIYDRSHRVSTTTGSVVAASECPLEVLLVGLSVRRLSDASLLRMLSHARIRADTALQAHDVGVLTLALSLITAALSDAAAVAGRLDSKVTLLLRPCAPSADEEALELHPLVANEVRSCAAVCHAKVSYSNSSLSGRPEVLHWSVDLIPDTAEMRSAERRVAMTDAFEYVLRQLRNRAQPCSAIEDMKRRFGACGDDEPVGGYRQKSRTALPPRHTTYPKRRHHEEEPPRRLRRLRDSLRSLGQELEPTDWLQDVKAHRRQ